MEMSELAAVGTFGLAALRTLMVPLSGYLQFVTGMFLPRLMVVLYCCFVGLPLHRSEADLQQKYLYVQVVRVVVVRLIVVQL